MYYLQLIYALATHLDFLYFCFVDQDSAHAGSPIRHPDNPRHNLRGNGQGCGRGRGRGLAGVGRVARQQDPPIAWSRNYVVPADRPFAEPSPGRAHRYSADSREGTFFDAMFTDDMWELMVTETNRYHDQQVAAEPNKHKRKWGPVTRNKMEAIIGILIYMGIVKLPQMRMYWSTDILVHQESFSTIMTQTRFMQIWRYFHLADNSSTPPREDPGFNKIYRVRQIFRFCIEKLSKIIQT